MRLAAAAAMLAAAMAAPGAYAYAYCDEPAKWPDAYKRQEANRKALEQRRFDDLDTFYGRVLGDFEAGKISDAQVDLEFRAFAQARAEHEPLLAEWGKLFPKSRAAHLAAAFHWIERAWAWRGEQLAYKTSNEQFDLMQQAFEVAVRELDAAEALAKNPTPELGQRIRVLQAGGRRGTETPTAVYRRAIGKYPQTLSVRVHYAHASMPQWGGSFALLEKIREEATALPADDRRYVQSMVDVQIGNAYSFRKEYKDAAKAYERAAPGCPALVDAPKALLWIYADARDHPALIAVATRYLQAYPNTTSALVQRGYAYVTVGKYDDAFRDFNKAAQLGNGVAYEHLAWMHERGYGLPKYDYAKAIEYYMLAHAKGVVGAKEKADRIRAATGLK